MINYIKHSECCNMDEMWTMYLKVNKKLLNTKHTFIISGDKLIDLPPMSLNLVVDNTFDKNSLKLDISKIPYRLNVGDFLTESEINVFNSIHHTWFTIIKNSCEIDDDYYLPSLQKSLFETSAIIIVPNSSYCVPNPANPIYMRLMQLGFSMSHTYFEDNNITLFPLYPIKEQFLNSKSKEYLDKKHLETIKIVEFLRRFTEIPILNFCKGFYLYPFQVEVSNESRKQELIVLDSILRLKKLIKEIKT